MIDPGLIIAVANLAHDVYKQAQKAKELKPLSRSLAARAQNVFTILDNENFKKQVEHTDNPGLETALQRIASTLNDRCLPFVAKINKPGVKAKIKRFINAGDYNKQRDEIAETLDSTIHDVNLSLNIGMTISEAKAVEERVEIKEALQAEMVTLGEYAQKILEKDEESLEDLGIVKADLTAIKEKLEQLGNFSLPKTSVHQTVVEGQVGGSVRVVTEHGRAAAGAEFNLDFVNPQEAGALYAIGLQEQTKYEKEASKLPKANVDIHTTVVTEGGKVGKDVEVITREAQAQGFKFTHVPSAAPSLAQAASSQGMFSPPSPNTLPLDVGGSHGSKEWEKEEEIDVPGNEEENTSPKLQQQQEAAVIQPSGSP